jgi:hypothetical protein
MKTTFISSFLFLFISTMTAQQTFTGTYTGLLNGEKVSLSLESAGGNLLKGEMKDSENTYVVNATWSKNTLKGNAVEKVWGIEFEMDATLNGSQLATTLTMDILGFKQGMEVSFNKVQTAQTAQNTKPTTTVVNPVAGKSRDNNVAGTWVKESNYSSGYGFNNTYGSMSSRETMVFLPDGRMADGGSTTVISGGNYSGTSSGGGGNVIDGVFWYTENSRIFLNITQEGQSQNVELGRYYIENGKMLITAANGEKLLLFRQ